jgi:hypothetical protein
MKGNESKTGGILANKSLLYMQHKNEHLFRVKKIMADFL